MIVFILIIFVFVILYNLNSNSSSKYKDCVFENGQIVSHGWSGTCPDGCNTCNCYDGMITSTKMACI